MTLLLADIPSGETGRYGATKAYMLDGVWAEVTTNVNLAEDPDPNITGNVVTMASGRIRYVFPSGAQNTAGMGTRVWLNNIPTTDGNRPGIHQYRDASNNVRLVILVSPTGALQVYRDTDATTGVGTLVGATAGPVMVAQSWRHVESKVLWSTTVGTVEVRIEGVVVLSLTNVNTGAGNYAQAAVGTSFSSATVSQTLSLKDIWFWDAQGTENNDFIGPCGVYRLVPNADVSSGWSRTSGTTDWELVDEAPPDDAGYIYADDSPPAPSIMNLTDLPADIVGVRGLVSFVRFQKSDAGDGSAQVSMSPNGVDYDAGATNAISTAFQYYYDVSEVSPDTTAPWTPVEVNAMEIKLNRTV